MRKLSFVFFLFITAFFLLLPLPASAQTVSCNYIGESTRTGGYCDQVGTCPAGTTPETSCRSITGVTDCNNASIPCVSAQQPPADVGSCGECIILARGDTCPEGWSCVTQGCPQPREGALSGRCVRRATLSCGDPCDYSAQCPSECAACSPTGRCHVAAREPYRIGPALPESLQGDCPGDYEIDTGLGCIPTQPQAFVRWFLGWTIGIAGGIAFLLILFGGFRVITSAGNPDQLQGGKDLITAAIAGLLLIIFSLFLLRLIGIEILQLPGFPRG